MQKKSVINLIYKPIIEKKKKTKNVKNSVLVWNRRDSGKSGKNSRAITTQEKNSSVIHSLVVKRPLTWWLVILN